MNIPASIQKIYPQSRPGIDYIIQDDSDGKGPYIAHWNLTDPQPAQSELEAAWAQVKDIAPTPSLEEQLKNLQKAFNEFILGG